MSDLLEFHVAEFGFGIANDVAKFAIYAEPPSREVDVSHADTSLLEGETEMFFAFAQGVFELGAAAKDFLYISVGLCAAKDQPRSWLAASHAIEGGNELGGDSGLNDVGRGSRIQSLLHHFRYVVLTHDEHGSFREDAANFASGFETVQVGHADVHGDDIWLEFQGFRDGVPTVDGFPADVEVGPGGKERTNPTTNNFVVINNENTHSSSSRANKKEGTRRAGLPPHYRRIPLGGTRLYTGFPVVKT